MNLAYQFLCDMAENISMPKIYINIRQLISNPDANIVDFVQIIEPDHMLSTRIIRMANSDFFGFHRQVENLEQAINLIGIIQLHDLVIICLCMRTFSTIPEQIFNLKIFWNYNIQCGIAAKIIAEHNGLSASNRFFALGFLHEIGHAAMFVKAPDLSIQALIASQAENHSIAELERKTFSFDYGELGAELMKIWHLPKIYQQVAEYHLQPQKADKTNQHEIEIIQLSHIICQNFVISQNGGFITHSDERNQQLKKLKVNDDIILNNIDEHANSILTMLWPDSAPHLSIKQSGAQT